MKPNASLHTTLLTNCEPPSKTKWPYLGLFNEATFNYGKTLPYFITTLFIVDILLLIMVYHELGTYRLF
jgi:hypothetical protein